MDAPQRGRADQSGGAGSMSPIIPRFPLFASFQASFFTPPSVQYFRAFHAQRKKRPKTQNKRRLQRRQIVRRSLVFEITAHWFGHERQNPRHFSRHSLAQTTMLIRRLSALIAALALLASAPVLCAAATPSTVLPAPTLTSKELSTVMDLDSRARKADSPRLAREVIARARKMAHEAISDRATPQARAQALVAIAIALQNGGGSRRSAGSRSPDLEMDRVLLSADRVLIVGVMLANHEPNADLGLAEATDYSRTASGKGLAAQTSPRVARGAGAALLVRPASRDEFLEQSMF